MGPFGFSWLVLWLVLLCCRSSRLWGVGAWVLGFFFRCLYGFWRRSRLAAGLLSILVVVGWSASFLVISVVVGSAAGVFYGEDPDALLGFCLCRGALEVLGLLEVWLRSGLG